MKALAPLLFGAPAEEQADVLAHLVHCVCFIAVGTLGKAKAIKIITSLLEDMEG